MVQPVLFPAVTAFDLSPATVHVPTLNTMEQCWVAANGNPFLDPLGAGDTDSELICTRQATFLPFSCVANCLAPRLMCNLLARIGQPLVDAGRGQEMTNLLDWIHVASVSTNVQVGPAIQLNEPLTPPLANAGLLGYLGSIIQH